MPSEPPPPERLQRVREEFAARRGIGNVAMAVDGTHCPFRGGADYRNYKGWESILLLAFVNSFHLFVDGDVGAPGRAGDNTVLAQSWMMQQVGENPESWLGPGGMIAADGGASDGGQRLLNPVFNPREPIDMYYNFCHSSTRFFVEETFGRFKNRFRFLLYSCSLSHKVRVFRGRPAGPNPDRPNPFAAAGSEDLRARGAPARRVVCRARVRGVSLPYGVSYIFASDMTRTGPGAGRAATPPGTASATAHTPPALHRCTHSSSTLP